MKTPEEIKKGLDMCIRMAYSDECPYFKTGCRMGNMLMRDALHYIKQLEAQVPRWISVEERMPEHGSMSMCKTAWFYDILQFDAKTEQWLGPRSIHGKGFVTHWMPMPEPPKEDG